MNDVQRVTWTAFAILVMFLKERITLKLLLGGLETLGRKIYLFFHHQIEGKRLVSFFGHPLRFAPGDFFIGCSITTVCTDSDLYEALNY